MTTWNETEGFSVPELLFTLQKRINKCGESLAKFIRAKFQKRFELITHLATLPKRLSTGNQSDTSSQDWQEFSRNCMTDEVKTKKTGPTGPPA